jgi:hypothetical protein
MSNYEKELHELTKEQRAAVRKLENALKACRAANVRIHNCYGNLVAYDGNNVKDVTDEPNELPCSEGHYVTMHGYNSEMAGWADDAHFIQFF